MLMRAVYAEARILFRAVYFAAATLFLMPRHADYATPPRMPYAAMRKLMMRDDISMSCYVAAAALMPCC